MDLLSFIVVYLLSFLGSAALLLTYAMDSGYIESDLYSANDRIKLPLPGKILMVILWPLPFVIAAIFIYINKKTK